MCMKGDDYGPSSIIRVTAPDYLNLRKSCTPPTPLDGFSQNVVCMLGCFFFFNFYSECNKYWVKAYGGGI